VLHTKKLCIKDNTGVSHGVSEAAQNPITFRGPILRYRCTPVGDPDT
jgi:hypothetical protein